MNSRTVVFVGGLNRKAPYFAGANGVGLSVYEFDEDTLETKLLDETGEIDNPAFLSVTRDGTRIYANSEVFAWREGTVTAYAFDRTTGKLSYINKQPTRGSITAHNSISRDGTKLFVVNYAMGEGGPDQALVAYGINSDGSLTRPLDSVAHSGSGPNAARQERSHPHSVNETEGGLLIVADLGIDSIFTYRFADGAFEEVAETALKPGAGPRHVALHPAGKFVFVMNELDSTVVSLALDPESGSFIFVDVKPAVPATERADNFSADIQISPDGRFLYGSNRGHDSIAIIAVDQHSGKLTPLGYNACGGNTPRNIALTPSGRHLFSANQNSDRITIFGRDAETGLLTDTGRTIATGTPMCVRIVD